MTEPNSGVRATDGLISELRQYESDGVLWCCRDSSSGRGLRIHQTRAYNLYTAPEIIGGAMGNTPQEAIAGYLAWKKAVSAGDPSDA
jgi:hypothetical protein